MSEMKSAMERAMEKVEKLGKPTTEELQRLEYIPVGNSLASKYLHDDQYDLASELKKYQDNESRRYIIKGAHNVFFQNITLPHDEQAKQNLAKAMKGIRLLKENKKQLDTIYERINNLITYYEQALQQAFLQFKNNFEAKVQETAANLQQRHGNISSIETELQKQFQDEWRRISNELDSKYETALEEHRQQILNVT